MATRLQLTRTNLETQKTAAQGLQQEVGQRNDQATEQSKSVLADPLGANSAPSPGNMTIPRQDSTDMPPPYQLILFGPPGSGKSNHAKELAKDSIIVRTVFHPETTYSDFTAKLLPTTNEKGDVSYEVHPGAFVKALVKALMNPEKQVALLIEEINRGQSAAIFGDLFQLLDRDNGVSRDQVDLPKLVVDAIHVEYSKTNGNQSVKKCPGLENIFDPNNATLKLPKNLSLIGTMNTSDESVYYMDAAFKRRWAWKFLPWNFGAPSLPDSWSFSCGDKQHSWLKFLEILNSWIIVNAYGAAVDDKILGYYFLREPATSYQSKADSPQKCMEDTEKLIAAFIRKHYMIPQKAQSVLAALEEFNIIVSRAREYFFNNTQNTVNIEPLISQLEALINLAKNGRITKIEWHSTLNNQVSGDINGLEAKTLFDPSGNSKVKGFPLFTQLAGIYVNIYKKVESCKPSQGPVTTQDIRSPVSHHLWDNVFARDRTPIQDKINEGREEKDKASVRTYGEFSDQWETFVNNLMKDSQSEAIQTDAQR